MGGTLDATESRVSFSHFTQKSSGWEKYGRCSRPVSGQTHTHCSERICQKHVPEGLPGINFNQCFPCSQEVLGILVIEAGPCVRQLIQEGPAAGGEALGDKGLGLRLQRADLRNCGSRAEPQSGEDVVHSLLQGEEVRVGGRSRPIFVVFLSVP